MQEWLLAAGKGKGRLHPSRLQKELSPAEPLTLAQARSCQTPSLQNCKISLYYFKPLNLWPFVTAVTETNTTGLSSMQFGFFNVERRHYTEIKPH